MHSDSIEVLVFVPQGDHADVTKIFGKHFKPVFVQTLEEVLLKLRQQATPVLICEKTFSSGLSWKEVLKTIQGLSNPPHLVVVHKHADHHLWCEVLELGGYNVLRKPYEIQEMFRIIRYAASEWLARWDTEPK